MNECSNLVLSFALANPIDWLEPRSRLAVPSMNRYIA